MHWTKSSHESTSQDQGRDNFLPKLITFKLKINRDQGGQSFNSFSSTKQDRLTLYGSYP